MWEPLPPPSLQMFHATIPKFVLSGRDEHHKSVQHLALKFSPMSKGQEEYVGKEDRARTDLANLIRKEKPHSSFIQLHDKTPFAPKVKPPCPPSPRDIAQNMDHPYSVDELQMAMTLSTEDIERLQKATVDQSASTDWLDQRIGRITASNFRSVFTRTNTLAKDPTADPKALIKSLMGYGKMKKTVAMKHGISMEPHAKKAYTRLQARLHNKFTSDKSGLVVSKEDPVLAASPDLLVTCQCSRSECQGGPGLCEIKCPESVKDQIPSADNWSPLVRICDTTQLSHTSPYYSQIQGQMAILGRRYCDLFVYTSHGHHLERIVFDEEHWDLIKPNLLHFWQEYLAPELMFGTIAMANIPTQTVATEHNYSRTCPGGPLSTEEGGPATSCGRRGPLSKPKLPLVFMCGVCMAVIEDEPTCDEEQSVECSGCKVWQHKQCARVQMSDVDGMNDWMCPLCNA